ncbi:single-stranded DNA-binding protein [Lysinibacillus boronitolerans]|uniref:Single-stranded DNA-binding protein n=1 Tax=Lysinibacillus boronitolerans JCM 21713 = 10a = NBRC 103108 TaxID=1294264 RepID=A0ABR4Y5L2_9BACI|nr:single-stranded DNA-binding protein [Lysinibacillus boronitolerans]KGR88852.1 single-stranded DNA-binding protein [Lysinibacillus boronitolerans JCM 21713 = 10a = NBRC 103108]
MINRTVIVGRLVADPELRYTPNGIASCKFRVAVNRPFKNEGEQQADFISCVAWRKQAENLANFMKKGNLIGLEGRIQTGSYEGQDGKKIYTTDVVADSIQFLEPRNSTGSTQNTPNYQSSTNTGGMYQGSSQGQYGGNTQPNYSRVDEDPFANSKGPIEVSEDDLPFD